MLRYIGLLIAITRKRVSKEYDEISEVASDNYTAVRMTGLPKNSI